MMAITDRAKMSGVKNSEACGSIGSEKRRKL